MPEWIQLMLGPGGALVVLSVISVRGFKFFSAMIVRQDKKHDAQEVRFNELLTSTLKHIHAQTEAVRILSEKIEVCENRPLYLARKEH